MRHRRGGLALVTAVMLACGPTTQTESAEGDGAWGGGSDGQGATGPIDPVPVGDGCAAPDCGPQLLWVHATGALEMVVVSVDPRGRPMWVEPAGSATRVNVVAYDPATDSEQVLAGPFDADTAELAFATGGPDGLRVLLPPRPGRTPRRLLRVDEDGAIAWSLELEDTRMNALGRASDGTSYVQSMNDEDGVRIIAVSADGDELWRWERSVWGAYTTNLTQGTVADDPTGTTWFLARYDVVVGTHEWLFERIEDGRLLGTVDIAPVLPEWFSLDVPPVALADGWLVPSRRPGGGIALAKFDSDAVLEWHREDLASPSIVGGCAHTDLGIACAVARSTEASTVALFELRSYWHDGSLRGSLTVDVTPYVEAVTLAGWPDAAVALPDGTVVVQLYSGESGMWLVGIRP